VFTISAHSLTRRLLPYDRYWPGIIALTGDKQFVKYFRHYASELGFYLDDYVICRRNNETGELGPPLKVQSEEQVFSILKLKYIVPEQRTFRYMETSVDGTRIE